MNVIGHKDVAAELERMFLSDLIEYAGEDPAISLVREQTRTLVTDHSHIMARVRIVGEEYSIHQQQVELRSGCDPLWAAQALL